jgi:hypothetical protein
MRHFRSALAAVALSSGLAGAADPLETSLPSASAIAEVLRRDSQRLEVAFAVLDNARERTAMVRRQLAPVTDPTTRLVMQAALRAINDDALRQLRYLLEPQELERLRGQTSSL